MCSTPSMNPSAEMPEPEVIKTAVQADASASKADAQNRTGRGLVSENIKTANTGIEEDISASKKKLLGE